jgi:hypothetical protein
MTETLSNLSEFLLFASLGKPIYTAKQKDKTIPMAKIIWNGH